MILRQSKSTKAIKELMEYIEKHRIIALVVSHQPSNEFKRLVENVKNGNTLTIPL